MRARLGFVLLVSAVAAIVPRPEARAAPRSEDDRGFSILLTNPSESFLTGVLPLRVEAIIPRGDRMEQVDFFLDGRLLATDRKEPYETDADFGHDIRRHTVEVRATTRDGRRARVTLISRSGDMADGAVVKVVTVPVVAFRGESDFLDDLGVSDFLVSEDGDPRGLIQFSPGPFPTSVAVVLGAAGADWDETVAELGRFAHALPAHDATALIDAPSGDPATIAEAFSYDSNAFAARLAAAAPPAAGGLADRIAAAAAALKERRGPRVLLVVLPAPEAAIATLEDPTDAALEKALEAGAVVYAVMLGPEGSSAPDALRDAADRSGGAVHAAEEVAGMSRALQEIAAELRHRYLLAFTPAEEGRAGWRAVHVRLRGKEGGVRAPRSIFVP